MLRLSKFPFSTLKTAPKVSDNYSTSLLLQSGLIRQEMAGVYAYTSLGLRVLRNIEAIVRDEMEKAGAFEVLLPALGSKLHWEQTGRWDTIDVLFQVPASTGKEYALNPTHEDIVTPLLTEFIQSYKDLNFGVFQIQTKFRNEKRAKSGLLRGREFLMKDLYSFHTSEADLETYYENMKGVYKNVFERLGIGKDTYITVASGGDFTDKFSHEFQTLLPIGEDTIYICESCGVSHNEEVINPATGFVCMSCGAKNCREETASEVGNIFPLMTKFSDACGMKYTDANGKDQSVYMGCYGIGISRLMGVMAEYFMTEKGIVWPENVAPYTHCVIVLGEEYLETAEKLALGLEKDGYTVLLDDRMGKKFGFGQKAGDCELWGIPNRIVISKKTIEKGGYELKKRGEEEQIIAL